jgi:hypothetical protein
MDSAALVNFSRRFGALEVSLVKNAYTHETFPEITILSKVKVGGKQIGATQFGETWHTDFHFFEHCGYATLTQSELTVGPQAPYGEMPSP